MAMSPSHTSMLLSHEDKERLSPQEEQVLRMRRGEQAELEEALTLASGHNEALRAQLLALEAQTLARAPEPRLKTRLRLVKTH